MQPRRYGQPENCDLNCEHLATMIILFQKDSFFENPRPDVQLRSTPGIWAMRSIGTEKGSVGSASLPSAHFGEEARQHSRQLAVLTAPLRELWLGGSIEGAAGAKRLEILNVNFWS